MAVPRVGLRPAQARGTMAILRPSARRLSPAVGLLTLGAPALIANLRRCAFPPGADLGWGVGAAAAFAREVVQQVGATVRVANSQSLAVAHLPPGILGDLLGLALSRASEEAVKATLRLHGIESNRVHGRWTGVSLARYHRLVALLRQALDESFDSPALALLLWVVWEKSDDKGDVLEFLVRLHGHVPVLAAPFECLVHDPDARAEWIADRFTPDDLSDRHAAAAVHAALAPLQNPSAADAPSFPAAVEWLAAALAPLHAAAPPIRLQRHPYRGGKEVTDCVEVLVREILDCLLFDPSESRSDPTERLPETCPPGLRAFYADPSPDAAGASRRWFDLCQGLPGCEYLRTAPDGHPYELKPGIRNVARAAGHLLGHGGSEGLGSLIPLASWWNQRTPGHEVVVGERVALERTAVSDEAKPTEVVTIRRRNAPHFIEFTMEASSNIATATHRCEAASWIASAQTVHLDHWARRGGSLPSPAAPLAAVWSTLLGDTMLPQLGMHDTGRPASVVRGLQALLGHPWGEDRHRFAPIGRAAATAEPTLRDVAVAAATSRQAARRALRCATALRSPPDAHLLRWLIKETAAVAPAEALAEALAVTPVGPGDDPLSALTGRPDADLVVRMARYRRSDLPLRDACRGLPLRHWLPLLVFAAS